jgi:hypothetical protein
LFLAHCSFLLLMVPCFYLFISFEQSSHLTLWSWPWPMISFVSSSILFVHSVLLSFYQKKVDRHKHCFRSRDLVHSPDVFMCA